MMAYSVGEEVSGKTQLTEWEAEAEDISVSTIRAKDNRYYSICYPASYFRKLPKQWRVGDSWTDYVYEDRYQNLLSKTFRFVPELSAGYVPDGKAAVVDISAKGRVRFNDPSRKGRDDLSFDCGIAFGGALNYRRCFRPKVQEDLGNARDFLGVGGIVCVDFDFDIKYSLYRVGLEVGCTYNALFGGSSFRYKGYQIAPCVQAKFEWDEIDWGKNMMGVKIGWKYGGVFTGIYGSF